MRNDPTKYYQLKTQSGVDQTDHVGQRANFREYLDGFLALYDIFKQNRDLSNKCFGMVEDVKRLFDQTNEKPPESERWVTFESGNYVTWEYLLESTRLMCPALINDLVHVCIETGSTRYFVTRVEDIPVDSRKNAGHHQYVWIKNPRTGDEFRNSYPGSFFRKLELREDLIALIADKPSSWQ